MAKQAKPETVQVLLLAGRTGYGRRGAVVDYPAAEAAEHAARGTVKILSASDSPGTADSSSADAEPLESLSIPGFPARSGLAAEAGTEAATDGDADEPPAEVADAYEKKPLKQKRKR